MYSRLLVRHVGVIDRIFSRLHSGSVQAKMVAATSKDFKAELSIAGPYFCKKTEVTSVSGDWRSVGTGQLLEHFASA